MRYGNPTRSRLTFLSLILPLRHVYSLSACGPGALFRASGGGGHASPFRPLGSPFFVPLRRGVPRGPGETGGGGLKSVFGAVPGSPSAEEASAGGAPGRGRTNWVARSPRGPTHVVYPESAARRVLCPSRRPDPHPTAIAPWHSRSHTSTCPFSSGNVGTERPCEPPPLSSAPRVRLPCPHPSARRLGNGAGPVAPFAGNRRAFHSEMECILCYVI